MWRWLKLRTTTGEQTNPGLGSLQQTRCVFVWHMERQIIFKESPTYQPLWAKSLGLISKTSWLFRPVWSQKIPQIPRPIAHEDYLHFILLLSAYLTKSPSLYLFFFRLIIFSYPPAVQSCSTLMAQDVLRDALTLFFSLFPTGCNPKRAERV